jgi:hypothetical protein
MGIVNLCVFVPLWQSLYLFAYHAKAIKQAGWIERVGAWPEIAAASHALKK